MIFEMYPAVWCNLEYFIALNSLPIARYEFMNARKVVFAFQYFTFSKCW